MVNGYRFPSLRHYKIISFTLIFILLSFIFCLLSFVFCLLSFIFYLLSFIFYLLSFKHKMIYPENFEYKIGFDRIRKLLSEECLSPMGAEQAESLTFTDDYDVLTHSLSITYEFQQLLQFEDYFPSDHYYKISDCLNKIRIQGTFPDVQEVFDMKRSLETVKAIIGFFRTKEAIKYPVLQERCSSVKMYPYVLDAIDRIIDRKGIIRDNASSRLKEIRSELISKGILVSKRLNAILKQAQSEGIVDADTSASVRNGRGVIPVSVYDRAFITSFIGLVPDSSYCCDPGRSIARSSR